MSEYKEIIVEAEGGVTTTTLNKPETLNALGRVNSQERLDALLEADSEDDVRCVVLTSGRAFCAG